MIACRIVDLEVPEADHHPRHPVVLFGLPLADQKLDGRGRARGRRNHGDPAGCEVGRDVGRELIDAEDGGHQSVSSSAVMASGMGVTHAERGIVTVVRDAELPLGMLRRVALLVASPGGEARSRSRSRPRERWPGW